MPEVRPAYTPPKDIYPSREDVNRDRVLDACVVAVGEHGLHGLRMNHIIDNSGLSRPSVYRYYKNKEAVLVAAFTREVVRLSSGLAAEMARHADLEDKFVHGLLFAYDVVPSNPIIRLIIEDNREVSKLINADTQNANAIAQLGFAGVVQAYPKIAIDLDAIWRYWQRALLPLFLVPGEELESKAALENYIRQRIVPGFQLEKYAN